MQLYNPKKIEPKWQNYWLKKSIYKNYRRPKKFYSLDMFPYISGSGIHVGHPKGYIATDVFSRFKMLQGFSVLHPMGWDAFGLPAENYAIKNKINPSVFVKKNIEKFKKQLKMFGFTYDWDKEFSTTDSNYYKWTQWIFLKMFEKGLAYESDEPVNWCPDCKTVLANEDLEGGKCERCDTQVIQKKMRQWVLRMTRYADRLLYDLDSENLDWEELIKEQQRNWIGRSEGVELEFKISNHDFKIKVYTTRIDTIFGCTYCVVAPEHQIIRKLKKNINNYSEVEKYIIQAQNKTNLERTDLQKEKTGVEIKGIKAINPFNKEEIPIFVADYVLGFYGTGAVMAVPAHDERDFEFAKKYNLPINQSITSDYNGYKKTIEKLSILNDIYERSKKSNIKIWLLGGLAIPFYSRVIYREHGDIDLVVKDEENLKKAKQLIKSIGFVEICNKRKIDNGDIFVYRKNGLEIEISKGEEAIKIENAYDEEVKSIMGFKSLVLSYEFIRNFKKRQLKTGKQEKDKIDIEYLNGKVFVENGILVNSREYSGLTSENACEKMTRWLEKEKIGRRKVNYKMRDWVFSRQRYWGEPIPIVHCEKCGAVPVPEKELPLKLPKIKSYKPTGTEEGPLANVSSWVNTECPKCGGHGKRETNTMPQWAGSSWYYLRYIDPKNNNALIDKNKEKKWMPVDLYVGGAEHATRHLLYARFWHKFLYDIGVVSTKEPFKKLVHVGLVNGEDGRKMSKRWGNVINPDDVIDEFGADSLRLYEMFMGPFSQNIAWSTDGVKGIRRFLEKIHKLQFKLSNDWQPTMEQISLLHKTIKKVTEDIESFKFNTAVSQMMILVNSMEKEEKVKTSDYQSLIILLSPFAPHIAEELWHKTQILKNNLKIDEKRITRNYRSIFLQKWPQYDPKLINDKEIEFVIQINGKVRDRINVNPDISEEEVKKIAMKREKIKRLAHGKKIKKTIFVRGKLFNIVLD